MKVEYSKMASVGIPLSEFSELCRLCGSKTSVLMGLHIFEREGDLREIYKKITACLPIQVQNTDKLPKMVCEECVYNLDALFEFRERSIKTEYKLNSLLKEVYEPVCTDALPISMDTLICETPTSTNGLQVQTGVKMEVNLDANGKQLGDIVITRVKSVSDSSIKCEPELFLETDSSQNSQHRPQLQQQVVQHRQLVPKESAHFTEEVIVPEMGMASEANSLGETEVHQSGGCTLGEGLDTNLEVQHLRNLESIDGEIPSPDVEGNSFLVNTSQEETGAESQTWFFCNICGKPFDSSHEFQAHCEIHWKKCTECGITCSNDQVLTYHMREAHPNPHEEIVKKEPNNKTGDSKSCLECGKTYRTNYKLMEHMRRHTGEKPYKCSMCEKTFRSKIGLAQHEAKHTGQFDYTCSTCGKGFQCKSYLIVHQRVHSDLKPYPCDTCGRNFKSKQSLLDHQNRHLGVKPYQCEICGRGFITKGLCKSHQKVHSGTDNRQYPCTVCNKLFVSKSYLATHLRIHTGEKPFMCEVCGKGFLTRVDLRIHSTMHTGEKSFVCEVCGKAFARRDALRCHKRSHTGERPYRCDVCGQGFTQFSPMAIHKRLHTGERPYSCDICSKTFVSRSTMMSHRKKHVS